MFMCLLVTCISFLFFFKNHLFIFFVHFSTWVGGLFFFFFVRSLWKMKLIFCHIFYRYVFFLLSFYFVYERIFLPYENFILSH